MRAFHIIVVQFYTILISDRKATFLIMSLWFILFSKPVKSDNSDMFNLLRPEIFSIGANSKLAFNTEASTPPAPHLTHPRHEWRSILREFHHPMIRRHQTESPTGPVERQVVLPFAKSIEIAFKNIRVRFVRSMITTISLVLAVAFLSFTHVSVDVVNGLLSTGQSDLRQKIIRSGYDVQPSQNLVENSPKQKWIVMLSLLVCVVGIVNAQLMSVTERFREIGTMKCLGALDRFILRLFLLEAGMQGLVGAGAGALLGASFSLGSSLLQYGTLAIVSIQVKDLLVSIGIAIGVGCFLSLVGVLYPALVAARMQPVEAMRVEE
jgi:putative ABC transport system permease protein